MARILGKSCRATGSTGEGQERPAGNFCDGAGPLEVAVDAGPPVTRQPGANGGERI